MKALFFILALLSEVSIFGQLDIHPLTEHCVVYTTYQDYKGTLFPSNSLYVITEAGVILIDPPWDKNQTLPLLDSIRMRHGKEVIASISTHFHADRTAGVETLQKLGIPTYATSKTIALCKEKEEEVPDFAFFSDTTFVFGNISIETYYPGQGHSPDNIVVYIPSDKVLFGGCLVKSCDSKGLGNLSDADLENWGTSIVKVKKKYRKTKYVIPGHEGWTCKNPLKHTLKLLRKRKK